MKTSLINYQNRRGNHCKEGMVMLNEVFKFVSNIKETADVTLATDDDKQLEAHKKSFTNYQASNFKIRNSLNHHKEGLVIPIKFLKTTSKTSWSRKPL